MARDDELWRILCVPLTNLGDRFFVVIPISQMGKLRFREIEHYTHYLTCLFPEVPTLCVVIVSPLVW